MTRGLLDAICFGLSAAAVAVFVPLAIWPDAALYRDVLTAGVLLRAAALVKLGGQLAGAVFAALCARHLEAGNPARTPWKLLSAGFGCMFAGQAVLGYYQFGSGTTPFPTVGDVFFLAAYPFLIAAFTGFVRAYAQAGYPVGSPTALWSLGLGATAILGTLAYLLLRPILAAPARPVERFLNAAYPGLDFVLLLPCLLLLQMTVRFRGGRVWRIWAALLAGIVGLAAGDICFAYFSVTQWTGLDPYVHATFVIAYLFTARGVAEQYLIFTR